MRCTHLECLTSNESNSWLGPSFHKCINNLPTTLLLFVQFNTLPHLRDYNDL